MCSVMDAPTADLRVVDLVECEPAPTAFSLPRLHAERLIEAHLPVLRRLHGNAQAMAALGGPRDAAETAASLERNLAHWERFGFGIWVLREWATGRVAGIAGLRRLHFETTAETELRCVLFPECWGRGLATEATRACVTIGRDWLGLASMVALTPPGSAAWQRVLARAGLGFEREVAWREARRLLFRTD